MTPSAFPCDADSALAELLADLTARLEAGGRLDPVAVAAEYPEHADELRRLLPALEALAASDRSAGAAESGESTPRRPRGRGGRRVWADDGRLGDFRIVRELGRGGMGIVYEAEQISLNRRVALKVLPFAAALNPRQLQRFKTEAQAAAQLHHAHIVPVFAVGCDNGVHYYAMQLIDGQTVADAIARMRAQTSPLRGGEGRNDGSAASHDSTVVRDPSTPAAPAASTAANCLPVATTVRSSGGGVGFRTVAELGAQAADALDYAHQVGVVHRDVKPANLMVDGRGHLWVTDFGLVRYADEGGLTLTGELLGTLRYMSPEQAAARRGVVDHRTDIYALGATLYELLTLAPVHSGRNRAELFAQIVGEEPVPPRRHNPAIPVELETVVLKALAKDAGQRYQTAEEFAADLRRFLADQPVKARRPGPGERLWRWARRHRRLVAGAAVMTVFGVGCLAASVVGISRERDEAVRRRAQARAAVDAMYSDVADKWLSGRPHLEPLQREFLRRALEFYAEFARDAGTDPETRLQAGRAALRVADIHVKLGEQDRAGPAYEAALDCLRRLRTEHPEFAPARAEWAVALDHRGVYRRGNGRPAEALADFRSAANLFVKLGDEPPAREGLAGSRFNAGVVLHALGRLADAETEYAAAMRLRHELSAADPDAPNRRDDLAACANNIGLLLEDLGRPGDAERSFTRAVTLWHELAGAYPGVPNYQTNYADGLHNRAVARSAAGRYADADRDFMQALGLRERLRRDFPQVTAYRRDAAASYHGRGFALAAAGRHAEAELALRTAYDLRQALVVGFSDDGGYRGDLAATHQALGDLQTAIGRWAAAGAAYRAALELLERLPGDPTLRQVFALATTRHALGRVHAAAGTTAEAERLYRESIVGLAKHADAGPAWGLALASAEVDLAKLLAATGRAADAEPVVRGAVKRAAAAGDQLPTAPAPREVLAGAWTVAGELAPNRPGHATADFEKALAARRWLAERPAARPRDLAELAWFLATCPDLRLRDPAGAVAAARSATDRASGDARVWTRLGVALCRSGDWRAAAGALERAETLKPGGDRTNWLFLAVAYGRLGDAEQARRWSAQVAEAGPAADADAEWARLKAEEARWLEN